jgi:carboxylate-amine ligase
MSLSSSLHLFDAYGIELEYMIVDRDSLQVRPLTDELLKKVIGRYESDFAHGTVTWSNELVLHVVELKSTKPEADLNALKDAFHADIRYINDLLADWNAVLMPAAAHPFMDPVAETRLWPHDNNEVYAIYNTIFDCRGHGWSNLQSTHLNLPFHGDDEFARLHAAIRIILPLLPALCASSPVLGGKTTGMLDTRMKYYKTNQAIIPSITGMVIPEPVFSEQQYGESIYRKIRSDLVPYDPSGEVLDPVWVNSRGAIARFDRGSIEIRVMDIQECPSADLALVTLVIETLKALVSGVFTSQETQMRWKTQELSALLDETSVYAQGAVIGNAAYLDVFHYPGTKATAGDLWQHIYQTLSGNSTALQPWNEQIDTIMRRGTLAHRIVNAIGKDPSKETITRVYRQLSACLARDEMFL